MALVHELFDTPSYVDPDKLVLTLAQSLFIFKKGFSQLTYKDFLQNGGETGENNHNPT